MNTNTATYISSLTEEEQASLIGDYFQTLSNSLDISNRHVEFLRMQENNLPMCTTAYEVLLSLDLTGKFSRDEIEILSQLDLFGLLHLKPEDSRDPANVNAALKRRLVINKVYEYLAKELSKQQKDTETTCLLETSENLGQQGNASVALTQLIPDELTVQEVNASEYQIIIKNIQSEIQSFSRLITKTRSFNTILEDIKKSTALISKIFENEELRQFYEDFWISSRAMEQSTSEFLGVVDDLSFLELFYTSTKEDINKKLERIKNDKRFTITQSGEINLSDQQKSLLQNDITNLYKLFSQRESEIKDSLRVLGLLSPLQIKALINLALLYIYLKNKSEKIYLEYADKNYSFDANIITSINGVNELVQALDNAQVANDSAVTLDEFSLAIIKTWVDLNKKISSATDDAEKNTLIIFKNILNQISTSVNLSYFYGLDLFANLKDKDSIFSLILLVINNIKLFYSTFIGDFVQIINNLSTENSGEHNVTGIIQSITNSIESRVNAQLKIAEKLLNLSDQDFKNLKLKRNDNLLKIVRREKKLLEVVSDHQGIISDLFRMFVQEKFVNFTGDDFDSLVSLDDSNISNLENVLTKLANEVAQKYSVIVHEYLNTGVKKNFTALDIADSNEAKQELFFNLQQAIAHFKQFGFYFIPDSKYNFRVEESKVVFNSYLNGWKTRMGAI